MPAGDERVRGWIYVLAGLASLIAGVISFFQPADGEKDLIGSLLVGLYLLFRGIHFVRES